MNVEFNKGDKVKSNQRLKTTRYKWCGEPERKEVDIKNGEILTVKEVVKRFGKQFLFFEEKNATCTIDFFSAERKRVRLYPLESSKFTKIRSAMFQEEMEL